MNEEIKLKILGEALKKHDYNYDNLDNFEEVAERVEDDPTYFMETLLEIAYDFGKKSGEVKGK